MRDQHRGRTWPVLGLLCLASFLTACGDESSSSSSSSPTPAVSVLPGESLTDATTRIYDACMDEFGQPYTLGEVEINGVATQMRGYDHNSPLYSAEHDAECRERVNSVIVPPTAAELAAAYSSTIRMVECIRASGFDIGVVVSEAEFMNNAGGGNMSSDWDAVASHSPPGFSEAVDRCFAAFAPPVTG